MIVNTATIRHHSSLIWETFGNDRYFWSEGYNYNKLLNGWCSL